MTDLSPFPGLDLPLWLMWSAPAAACAISGFLSFWVVIRQFQLRMTSLDPPPRDSGRTELFTTRFQDPPVRPIGRRAKPRQDGSRRPVVVVDAAEEAEPFSGWVENWTKHGLGLLVTQETAVGTALKVRNAHLPEETPTVPVEVRHCRPHGKRWFIGCKLPFPQPWCVLQQFE
jgi:hypothetical protein